MNDTSLDPADWDAFRAAAHRLLDAALDHVRDAREGPVWRPVSPELDAAMNRPLPHSGTAHGEVARELAELVLPQGVGNLHPRFFGWVHGAGTAGGVLAEMIAAALNANAGGRDHGAIRVERQVIAWAREIMGFPSGSSGLLVSGTSMANLLAVQVARTAFLGPESRTSGLAAALAARFPGSRGLVAYASGAVHSSLGKAMEVAGLGAAALRHLPFDAAHRLPPATLEAAIRADREAGYTPFLVAGTAGSVDIGATDDLAALHAVARSHGLWFHIDGAFGALLRLSPEPRHRDRLAGMERADSLAFDFHKWAHVPYDAGCLLVRDGALHHATFGMEPPYLARADRGTAAGTPWPCDYGVELSRGARAVKIWATLREHGLDRIGASIAANCRVAAALAARIGAEPELELLAPVPLNIVCFRHRPAGMGEAALDRHNHELACDVQETGEAVVSTTRIGGKIALRAAVVNHRTTEADIPILIKAVLAAGRERVG